MSDMIHTCQTMSSPYAHLSHRAVLSLTGPDTMVLLERLVTNKTTDWALGETRYGALLTPQGKVIADYLALRTSEGVLLDVAADYVDDLAKRLKMFRLRSDVQIEKREDLLVIAGLDDAQEGVRPVAGAFEVYLDSRYSGVRVRGLVPKDGWDASPTPLDAYHLDRIKNGVPEQGTDFGTAAVFPADINMDIFDGVALNKGCFVGQEVVSRMYRRGKIRKRTVVVTSPTQTPLESGANLMAIASIGSLTSTQSAHALALIRTDRFGKAQAEGQEFTVDETPVIIEKPDWLQREMIAQAVDG
jgi:folate-binding protein YgfZ